METAMMMPSSNTMASVTPNAPSFEAKVTYEAPKPQQQPTETQISMEEQKAAMMEASKELNDLSSSLDLDVKFGYNDKINEMYLNVTDRNTGEVVRKLPSEEAMKIRESMKDLVGVLFDKKG